MLNVLQKYRAAGLKSVKMCKADPAGGAAVPETER